MKIAGIELRRIAMPLVAPFRTSFGTETERDVLLVRVDAGEAEGWGECVAMSAPLYSYEHVDGAAEVIRRFLAPALTAAPAVDERSLVDRLGDFSFPRGLLGASCANLVHVSIADSRNRGSPKSKVKSRFLNLSRV